MFEFLKPKKEEHPETFMEELKVKQKEQKMQENEVIAKIGKPELETISHEVSELWSVLIGTHGESNDIKQEVEELLKKSGTELAAYLVQKRQIIEDRNFFPSHDDQFTSYVLWHYKFLEGKEWEKWDR